MTDQALWAGLLPYFLFMAIVFGFPAWRILRRLGLSGWWAVFAVLPIINVVGLWVLSFVKWPIVGVRSDA